MAHSTDGVQPSNPCIFSKIWENPKGKTIIITVIVLALLAVALTLGLYGVGFEKVHDWFANLSAGEWIGVGTGAATALLLIGGGYLVYYGLTRTSYYQHVS